MSVHNNRSVGKENVIPSKPKRIRHSKHENAVPCAEKKLSRGKLLENWRQEKGISKKEICHPLLSRKRPLSQVVASPSYTAPPKKTCSKPRVSLNPRRCTFTVNPLQNPIALILADTPAAQKKEKRRTIHSFQPPKLTSPKCAVTPTKRKNRNSLTDVAKTPWRNETLSRRERLDLWLAAKGKTPYVVTPHANRRKSTVNSPHPSKFVKKIKTPSMKSQFDREDVIDVPSSRTVDQNNQESRLPDLQIQLQRLLLDNETSVDEFQEKLDTLRSTSESVVHFADFWICRARLAAREKDVQRVICLLEQAYAFRAQPEEKIKEEICRFLQTLEQEDRSASYQQEQEEVSRFDDPAFAITPGRRVHFAVADSPVEFKSSIIRFCIVESKAFKRRLNTQLKKRVMTPVRRSIRLRQSDIPDYLRRDVRLIDSPTQVENDIVDGHVGFVPNVALDTPLNKGWLIHDDVDDDDAGHSKDSALELSFM